MRVWILALALLLTPHAVWAQKAAKDLGPDSFSAEIRDRAAAEIGAGNVRVVSPLRLGVIEQNGAESRVALDQTYSLCQSQPGETCEQAKIDLVASVVATHRGDLPAPSKARLRLLIRSTAYCGEVSRFYSGQDDVAILEQLAPGLCVLMMADYPETVTAISDADLDILGISRPAGWRIALEQTLGSREHFDRGFAMQDARARLDGRGISSVLLDSEAWDRVTLKQGELWVAVPGESTVLIRRAGSTQDLADMRAEAGREMANAARPVSALIYRYSKGKWVVVE